MPMPPVLDGVFTEAGLPHNEMGCARADFVIAAGAPIRLRGPEGRNRPDFVLIAVGADLDPARRR
jgi:hypothetical protein